MIPWPIHLALTAVLTIVWTVVGFTFLTVLGPDWSLYAPASCTPACFCELPRTGQLVLQPANALSSLAFVAVGGWIMLGAAQYRWSALGILAGLWLGFVVIGIGIGSLFLHATLTLWGQFADVLGMYLLGAFVLARAVARWQRLAAGPAVAFYLLLCVLLVGSLWLWPDTRRWLFALLLSVAAWVEWRFARPWRPGAPQGLLVVGLGLTLCAFLLWILDQTRTVCSPESLWQGHALWHLLNAAAVLAAYGYYRGETAADHGSPLTGRPSLP